MKMEDFLKLSDVEKAKRCQEVLKGIIKIERSEWNTDMDNYFRELEKRVEDSTLNLVIREKIEELKNTKTQLPVEHMRQAQIQVLEEILKE